MVAKRRFEWRVNADSFPVMRSLICLAWLVFAIPVTVSAAFAMDYIAFTRGEVTTCPARSGEEAPPRFDAPGCASMHLGQIDPQGRMIWVRMHLPVSEAALDAPMPLGVFVLAKASSEAYLNGVRLGANGLPGATRASERPGRMDVVFPVPRGLLSAGDNELVLRMSAQNGFLRLYAPVHAVYLGHYAQPQAAGLRQRWPALITFGELLAGAFYFAATAAGGEARRASALLALMGVSAAAQLFFEVSRALYAYAYPFHDFRLVAILGLAALFGLCLAAHIVWTFAPPRRVLTLAVITVLTLAGIMFAPGFDEKTANAVLTPALTCAVAAGIWTFQRRPRAGLYLAALIGFSAAIIIAPRFFLDVAFYYIVSALMFFLFVQHALAFAEERRARRSEAERASRLELVLEQTRKSEQAQTIKVASAGRIEHVPTSEIVYAKGAGDYVELRLQNGREILHNGSLSDLEASMPATFLRVHRSYIANTSFIQSLKRDPSGAGVLQFITGDEAPVSRRIMPKVRAALD
jgi:hypothetical protein